MKKSKPKSAAKMHAHHVSEAARHIKGAEAMMARIHSEMKDGAKAKAMHDPKTKLIGGKAKRDKPGY